MRRPQFGRRPKIRRAGIETAYALKNITIAQPSTNSINTPTVGKMTSLEEVNDKSHHNPSGGFTNPWPSFRYVSIFGFMNYARKNWNREASKVPPQSDLYVKVLEEKKMAWERIRNPPKDRIQATWCAAPHVNG